MAAHVKCPHKCRACQQRLSCLTCIPLGPLCFPASIYQSFFSFLLSLCLFFFISFLISFFSFTISLSFSSFSFFLSLFHSHYVFLSVCSSLRNNCEVSVTLRFLFHPQSPRISAIVIIIPVISWLTPSHTSPAGE